jgi:hypothetical protein
MYWISTEDRLPQEGKYVLARHNKTNWKDHTDQNNVNCVVVKLVRGISKEQREKMKSEEIIDPEIEMINPSKDYEYVTFKRSDIIFPEDEYGNNEKPYKWEAFGSSGYNGQEITHWATIKPIK